MRGMTRSQDNSYWVWVLIHEADQDFLGFRVCHLDYKLLFARLLLGCEQERTNCHHLYREHVKSESVEHADKHLSCACDKELNPVSEEELT